MQYVDWVKTGDLAAEWADEAACQAYGYKAETDMFKGESKQLMLLVLISIIFIAFCCAAVCDIKKKGGVTAAAGCCAACDQAKQEGCEAFTFFAGACFLKNCGAGGGSGRAGATQSIQGAVSGYLK